MITFITGGNGAGKTAWIVKNLLELPKQRKVYVHGIPELKVAHERVFCDRKDCDMCQEIKASFPDEAKKIVDARLARFHGVDYQSWLFDNKDAYQSMIDDEVRQMESNCLYIDDWMNWATRGSLIVVDEIARVWGRRNSASAVPAAVAALDTHRKKGLDMWFCTQAPNKVDPEIKGLCTRHIYLLSTWKGRYEFEWPEFRDNTQTRSDATKRPYSITKRVMQSYKSADVHTKQIHRLPIEVYMGLVAVAVVVYFGGGLIYKHSGEQDKKDVQFVAEGSDGVSGGASYQKKVSPVQSVSVDTSYPDFRATVNGLPASAPAYHDLVKVTSVPHITGCAATPNWCRCYTDQGTAVAVTTGYCVAFLKGQIFNPFRSVNKSLHDNRVFTQIASNSVE